VPVRYTGLFGCAAVPELHKPGPAASVSVSLVNSTSATLDVAISRNRSWSVASCNVHRKPSLDSMKQRARPSPSRKHSTIPGPQCLCSRPPNGPEELDHVPTIRRTRRSPRPWPIGPHISSLSRPASKIPFRQCLAGFLKPDLLDQSATVGMSA